MKDEASQENSLGDGDGAGARRKDQGGGVQRERGLHGDGGAVEDDGPPVIDDECVTDSSPRGRQNLLFVTGKRKGRPKKGILPDGIVQLRILNFINKLK